MKMSKWLLSRIVSVIVCSLISTVVVWCTYSDSHMLSVICGVVVFVVFMIISLAWGLFDRKVKFYV